MSEELPYPLLRRPAGTDGRQSQAPTRSVQGKAVVPSGDDGIHTQVANVSVSNSQNVVVVGTMIVVNNHRPIEGVRVDTPPS